MKSKLSVYLTSVVLALSLTSAAASAMNNGVGHENKQRINVAEQMEKSERFKQHKFKKMARYLELTREQRQQAKAIYQQAKESRLVVKDSLQDFHQQSKILTMEDNFNEQAFLALQSQYQDSFAQMALIKAKTKHSFVKLLTPEQKEKLQSHKAFGERRQHRSD